MVLALEASQTFFRRKNEVIRIKVVANSIQDMLKKFELDKRSASRKKKLKLKMLKT
jgi:hypothetical protein